jgi:hypothetical protein
MYGNDCLAAPAVGTACLVVSDRCTTAGRWLCIVTADNLTHHQAANCHSLDICELQSMCHTHATAIWYTYMVELNATMHAH